MHSQSVILILWTVGVLLLYRPRLSWRVVAVSGLVGLILLIPFLWYEANNDLTNLRAMSEYIGASAERNLQGNVITLSLERLGTTANGTQGFLPFSGIAHWIMVAAVIASYLLLLVDIRNKRNRTNEILALYGALPLLYVLWPGPIHPIYLEIVMPIPFLVLGYGLARLASLERRATYGVTAAVVFVSLWSAVLIYGQLRDERPTLDDLSVLRRTVETVIVQAQGRPLILRLDTSKNSEAFDSPYLYLFKWLGGRYASTGDAHAFMIFDPAERAPALLRAGTLIDGIRVVHFLPPEPSGDDLLGDTGLGRAEDFDEWKVRGEGKGDAEWDAKAGALALQGSNPKHQLVALQRLNIQPDSDYTVAFEYRNNLKQGVQDIALWCMDAKFNVTTKPTQDVSHLSGDPTEWQRGIFFVHTPPDCVAATIRLGSQGEGVSWFRNISVRPVRMELAP